LKLIILFLLKFSGIAREVELIAKLFQSNKSFPKLVTLILIFENDFYF